MIDLAFYYVGQGYRIFPVAPGNKVPAIPKERGGHGCLDATTDIAVIERWWREYPEANIGIAAGRGLLVIDVDPRKNERWLDSLNELALPQTLTIRTWSGGWHIYLSFPDDPRITIGADLLPGIDWRGNGGYVVAAGSVVQGATYTIAKNMAIAAAPAALLERIRNARNRRPIERDDQGHMIIPESRRNDTLMRIGCAIRRWGVEYNALLEALRAINTDHCEPAIHDEEVRQIAASVIRYPAAMTSTETNSA
ncbi:MAG TPA: bifunctional DNA primase/polymerase [Steroidobacteraceae bacterium]